MHTFVLEGTATKNRDNLVGKRSGSDTCFNLVLRQLACFEVGIHQLVIGFGRRLDKVLTHLITLINKVIGHRSVFKCCSAVLFVPDNGLVFDQVDHANELFLGSDGHLDRHGVAIKSFSKLLDNIHVVRTRTIHLVHEDHTRNGVLVCLPPDCLGLRLNT